MGQTDNTKADWWNKSLRKFFSLFDRGVYYLLVAVYQVFFNVASAQILQGDTLKTFFSRIQIILGVFVLFKLAINLINVIVNPDQLGSDKSGQGFSQIVVRVIIALIMLVAIMPLNIPGEIEPGSYEANLNANGLLFGTLYEFQDRVLEGNVLAKLVIGSPNDTGSDERNNMKDAGNQLASLVLKGFVRINLKKGETDEYDSNNWMCSDAESEVKEYIADDVSPFTILDMLTTTCKTNDGQRFVFTYTAFVGAIVSALFVLVILSFTIDIAMRAIKLAILRLISPIPIISYIDPKNQKDGAFASWVKAVTTTYLDLFLRLAIVYFVIFIIQDIMVNGLNIDETGGIVGMISWIFIALGLLFFARQAPKFIMSAMGIKSPGLGSVGLNGALSGAAALIGGAGVAGATAAALGSMDATAEAAAQGKMAPPAWKTGRDLAAKLTTGDKNAVGGIVGTLQRGAQRNAQQRVAARTLAREFGITQKGLDEQKNNMIAAQNRAKALETALQNGMGEAVYYDSKGNREVINLTTLTDEQRMDMLAQAQTAAVLTKSDYDKAAKIAEVHGLDQTTEEKYRSSMRERISHTASNVRHPVQSRSDQQRDRQTLNDRIMGANNWHPNDHWSPTGGPTTQQDENPPHPPPVGGPPPGWGGPPPGPPPGP